MKISLDIIDIWNNQINIGTCSNKTSLLYTCSWNQFTVQMYTLIIHGLNLNYYNLIGKVEKVKVVRISLLMITLTHSLTTHQALLSCSLAAKNNWIVKFILNHEHHMCIIWTLDKIFTNALLIYFDTTNSGSWCRVKRKLD